MEERKLEGVPVKREGEGKRRNGVRLEGRKREMEKVAEGRSMKPLTEEAGKTVQRTG